MNLHSARIILPCLFLLLCVPLGAAEAAEKPVLRGDGRELFRSETVSDQKLRSLDVDLSGVDTLELIVENAGNGNAADWGVWLEPTLKR